MSIGAGLSRLVSEMEAVRRERDEFAAALEMAKRGSDAYIAATASTFKHLMAEGEAKDAQIRQLRNVLAETARGLLTQPYERDNARVIARFLGYTNPSDERADVEAFLSSVSVEEPKT